MAITVTPALLTSALPGVLGLTPLHLAAANGKLAAAMALLHAGADPNTTDDDGGTPLHWAAASGHSRMCRLLLSEDVNPLVENFAGKTALDVAEDETTIEVLQRGMRDETPYRCAELGKIRSVRRMVSTNAVYKDATDGPRGFTRVGTTTTTATISIRVSARAFESRTRLTSR